MSVFIGDVGTVIVLDTGSTITDATSVKIKYLRPDGSNGEWTGTIYETTKVKYILQAGDLNVAGTWKLQAYVVLPTWSGYGTSANLEVIKPFI